jgi:alanine racemase
MVRPGLALYGVYPDSRSRRLVELTPAMRLKSRVVHVKPLPEGSSVSYGRTYIAKRQTRIAVVPVGYGDGYSRQLSNRAYVLIKGKRAPVIGRVCMDMIIVDVGHIRGVKTGDEVVLIGRQGKEFISVEEIASMSGTIPYEVVCNIGKRVPRVYVS